MSSCHPRAPPNTRTTRLMSDETAIRELLFRWADGVHTGGLETVLADRDPDIVMFDVPPPYEGRRGIDAYRESWPEVSEWQRQGAPCELTALDVTAGGDVPCADALAAGGK